MVRITDGNSCEVNDTIKVTPRYPACLSVPNVFSPNNDGANDYWDLEAGDPQNPVTIEQMYPRAIIEVFNRWGELMFRSAPGYPVPWDGTYKGRELPLDSYYYVIDPKNGTRPITGIVTIIK